MGQISLNPAMVRLFVAIDEEKPLARVAKEVGMNLTSVRQNLFKLVELGLVQHVEKRDAYLDQDFVDHLRENLALAVGPLAELLIEEVLEEMHVSTSCIPRYLAAELINTLARQVPRTDKRIEFQQNMIRQIPK